MKTPSADTLEAVLADANLIPWSRFTGAYGLSDALDHSRNMPGMLMALATVDDIESGTWGNAYDDAFLAHVWHQYTIYPVTPLVVGFVIRVASLRLHAALKPATQLALGLRLIAESTAAFRSQSIPSARELGEATATAFIAHGSHIRSWLATPLEKHAIAIQDWIRELEIA
jgi:hypothetical protein